MITCFLLAASLSLSVDNEDLPWVEEGRHGHELKVLRPILPENSIILEAGAHRGEDTVELAKTWPNATIYGFEPCPSYFSDLQAKVAPYPNIHVFPYGLFSEAGEYLFHMSQALDGASSLFEANCPFYVIDFKDVQMTVACKNLDEWANEMGVDHIDYMWLDMEGAELPVLSAAPRILQTVKAISTEVNFQEYRKGMTQFQEIKDFLERSGFYLYQIWGSPLSQATAIFVRLSPSLD